MTEEELKDEILSLVEEIEPELASQEKAIGKIEEEAVAAFERKAIAIRNRLVEDTAVPDEELEGRYLKEVEIMRKEVVEDAKNKLKDYLKTIETGQEENV